MTRNGGVLRGDAGRYAAAREDASRALPLYISSLFITLAGVGAVAATLIDWDWSQQSIMLILLGHLVSYLMRWRRVPAAGAYLPVSLLVAWSFVSQASQRQLPFGIPPTASLSPDQSLAVFLTWLVALRSFTLFNNGSLLFSSVPTLATLGLTGSSNPNSEITVFFAIFVFGTIFMAVYEQHLRRVSASGQGPWALSWHLSTATAVFLMTLVAGTVLGLVGGHALGTLSPYAVPALSRLNPAVKDFMSAPQANTATIPVGAGPIQLAETPVFDIYAPEPGLWRTSVLEAFDGRAWAIHRGRPEVRETDTRVPPDRSQSMPVDVRLPSSLYQFTVERSPYSYQEFPTRLVRQTIVARGQMSPQLPVLDHPVEVRYPENEIGVNRVNGTVRGSTFLMPGFLYEVTSRVPMIPEAALRAAPPCATARDLVSTACFAVPATAQRLRPLAEEITQRCTSDYDRVKAIIRYIEANSIYSLNEEPTPEGEDAVEFFLFTTKTGACDLGATSTIMLCRSIGIPSRAVVGYYVDHVVEGGGFQVRQMDAHMWVEVFFPGYGWVTFNPSPPSETLPKDNPNAALAGLRRFARLLGRGGMDTYLGLAIAILLALALGRPALLWAFSRLHLWRRDRTALAAGGPHAVEVVYRRMGDLLRRAGWARNPSMTPNEYLHWLTAEWGPGTSATASVARITERFVQACYADEIAPGAAAAAASDLEALRRQVPGTRHARRQPG